MLYVCTGRVMNDTCLCINTTQRTRFTVFVIFCETFSVNFRYFQVIFELKIWTRMVIFQFHILFNNISITPWTINFLGIRQRVKILSTAKNGGLFRMWYKFKQYKIRICSGLRRRDMCLPRLLMYASVVLDTFPVTNVILS